LVKLELTERQAEYLGDILDMRIEGHKGAVEDAQHEDFAHTYEEPEDLLRTIDQLNWQFADAVDMKMRLMEARRL